jgi:outer membrane protein assembly factor BamB
MKLNKYLLIPTLLLTAFLLSACGGNVGTATSWPGLSADEEHAYLAFNQFVYSIDLSDGKENWRFPTEGNNQVNYFAAPTLTPDGQLIVGDYKNILHSLDPATGTENWPFDEATDRYVSSSLGAGDLIYAPNANHELYALDLSGNVQWEFSESQGPLWAKPVPESSCECLYVPSMDHHLYAIDASTGAQKWKSEALGGSLVGTPALSPEGVLYVGTFGSQIFAIDSNNGKTLWSVPTLDWVWGGPVLKGDILYFGDLGGTLYALDTKTREVIWQKTPDGPITESPLVTEDSIYITTETGGVLAFELDGTPRWTQSFEGRKLHTSPVLGGDKILVAMGPVRDSPELLVAFDADGTQVWSFIPETKN